MKKDLCMQRTAYVNSKDGTKTIRTTYPCCVYFDSEKDRCELPFCYRALKERGKKK